MNDPHTSLPLFGFAQHRLIFFFTPCCWRTLRVSRSGLALFQWALSQVAVHVEPDLVKITPYYEPGGAAVWFQASRLPFKCSNVLYGLRVHNDPSCECSTGVPPSFLSSLLLTTTDSNHIFA